MSATEEPVEEVQENAPSNDANMLGMSDDEILNMAPPTDEQSTTTTEEVVEEKEEIVDDVDDEEDTQEDSDSISDEVTDDSNSLKDTSDKEGSTDKVETKPTEEDVKKVDELNYKNEYERLIAPFRANGKDIQVQNVDDAITLMQQGANYNKKMAGLKPNLKLMKMLENNELLDEVKLSYLIDLSKNNPEAIQKFIKDSGVDPLDIDTEANTEYKPSTYTVNDTEVELDAVLDDIRDTQSFNETIDIISNKWDASSKKVLLEQPRIIEVINGHVATGIYSQITQVIENERMLGRLSGLSDLEAYQRVGDVIQANGGFRPPQSSTSGNATSTLANEETSPPEIKADVDPKLKNRKRAASSTKQAPSKKINKDFNPLSMSDEEFDKITSSQYL